MSDDGRGVPVDIHPHAGHIGRGGGLHRSCTRAASLINDNYAYSGGLHGVGASVVNALSEWMTVDVYKDYQHYRQKFSSVYDEKQKKIVSGRPEGPLEKLGATRKHGTVVRFLPDKRVFDETRFNADTIARRMHELAFLNKGIHFRFHDARVSPVREEDFCFEGGLSDFVKYLNADRTPLNEEPILLEGERDNTLIRVALQYTDSDTEGVFSFVNNIPTGEGGTHETGFKTALTKVFNDYARRIGALKEKDNNLTGEDLREGLTAVLAVGVSNPQFEGQTKGRLGNTEVRPIVEAFVQRTAQPLLGGFEASGGGAGDNRQGHAGRPRARSRAQGARRGAQNATSWRPRRWWASCRRAPGATTSATSCS